MSDNITGHTGVKTLQLKEGEIEGFVINKPFMLTDLIVSSTSSGRVTIAMEDDEDPKHIHIIKTIKPNGDFNHSFTGGWLSWQGCKLKVIKEKEDGIVDVSAGHLPGIYAPSYSQWRLR
jgi:hypothetical protein